MKQSGIIKFSEERKVNADGSLCYADFILVHFRYEELIQEEKTTNNELSAVSRRIESWALGNSETEKAFRAISSKVPVDRVTQRTLPEQVVEFEKFLQQTGGRQGGWDALDHQNFVKVRNKHKGKPTFMKEVVEHLPGRTLDEVQQHEKWYQKFLTLEEKKKEVMVITAAVLIVRVSVPGVQRLTVSLAFHKQHKVAHGLLQQMKPRS